MPSPASSPCQRLRRPFPLPLIRVSRTRPFVLPRPPSSRSWRIIPQHELCITLQRVWYVPAPTDDPLHLPTHAFRPPPSHTPAPAPYHASRPPPTRASAYHGSWAPPCVRPPAHPCRPPSVFAGPQWCVSTHPHVQTDLYSTGYPQLSRAPCLCPAQSLHVPCPTLPATPAIIPSLVRMRLACSPVSHPSLTPPLPRPPFPRLERMNCCVFHHGDACFDHPAFGTLSSSLTHTHSELCASAAPDYLQHGHPPQAQSLPYIHHTFSCFCRAEALLTLMDYFQLYCYLVMIRC